MTFRESFTVCQKAGNGLGVSQSCENACLRKCVPAREVVDKCVEEMEHAIGSFGHECRHVCTHTLVTWRSDATREHSSAKTEYDHPKFPLSPCHAQASQRGSPRPHCPPTAPFLSAASQPLAAERTTGACCRSATSLSRLCVPANPAAPASAYSPT